MVNDLEAAWQALEEIIEEGEGFSGSIYEEKGEEGELAHYYRFDELYQGRRYVHGDTPETGQTGPPLVIDY